MHDLVACCEVPVVLEGFLYLDEDVDGLRARELLTGWLSGRGTWSVPKERCTRPRTREVGEGRPRPGRLWSAGKARQRLLVCRSWRGLISFARTMLTGLIDVPVSNADEQCRDDVGQAERAGHAGDRKAIGNPGV